MTAQVPMSTIAAIIISMVSGVLLPTALFIVLWRKLKGKVLPFIFGCLTMFVWAFVVEQIFHTIVLMGLPIGGIIQGNIWIYGVYGAFCAALFEEAGRFITMRFLLKKYHEDDTSAWMYGAGHGGFECAYLLVMGMINNLIYVVMINSGSMETIRKSLSGAELAQVDAAITALVTTSGGLFFVGILERIFAMMAQLAMSVFMWQAASKKKMVFFAVAFAMHFILDFSVVIINNYFGIFIAELTVGIIAVLGIVAAIIIYRRKETIN